jgi:hypothetical protein
MTIKAHSEDGANLQFAEVSAVITRADGSVEDLGVIDSYESLGHKVRRISRKWLPRIGLGVLIAAAVAHGIAPDLLHFGAFAPAATVITNAGQAIVTNRMTGAGTEPKFVMWGTGAGTAAITDTTLFTETTDEARTTGTSSRVTTTVTNDTYQVVGTITVATAGKTITNVGLFDVVTASSGNLYFKSDFTGLALLVGDSITFTIKVKFS